EIKPVANAVGVRARTAQAPRSFRRSHGWGVAVALVVLSALAPHTADAQSVLLRREYGNGSLLMEVTGEDSVHTPGPAPILQTEYVLRVTNYTPATCECAGKIAFYSVGTGSGSAFPASATATVPPNGPWQVVKTTVRSDAMLGLD